MNVTIIGTGNMARGLATRALAAGYEVTVRGTSGQNAEALAKVLPGPVEIASPADPITGDLVILAVPFFAIDTILGAYPGQFDGKIVIDITNPVDFSTFTPITLDAGSAAGEIAAKAPGARVVKAFNTTFAGTLSESSVAGQPLDVFIASDDDAAKQAVSQFVSAAGLRAVDAGPLARAHELEALGYLHMTLQGSLGTGFASTVKILA